jgi:hypothetical protein
MKKVEVFLRHCFYSKIQESPGKQRPIWWDKEKVFNNFKSTLNSSKVNYTIIYDEHYGNIKDTFLKNEDALVINEGSEARSFLRTLEYIKNKKLSDDTIVYFLEDDYLHRPNWADILIESFDLPIHYSTLYDHGDKYQEMYAGLMSQIFITKNSHWRPVPSTTNTFAVKYKTLMEDYNIHQKYSTNVEPTLDHQKFLELNSKGRHLISCLPGYSTHCQDGLLSPCIDWSQFL